MERNPTDIINDLLHRKIVVHVFEYCRDARPKWKLLETVTRTVMSRDGRLVIAYSKAEWQLKELRKVGDEEFELKIRHW